MIQVARAPDVVAEFVVGPICPPEAVLDLLAGQLSSNFLPEVASGRRSAAVCSPRDGLGTNVVTVGLWIGVITDSDAELKDELRRSDLLTSGRTIALFIPASSIEMLATLAWAATDKTLGRVTLDETITVDVRNGAVETVVSGSFDPPLLVFPDVDFTNTLRETLELAASGSGEPLRARATQDLDVGTPGLLAGSLIIGIISPILGAIVFFGAESVAEGQAPDVQGVGGALAAQWPSQILTPVSPPFLPGAFALSWTDLTVDEAGVLTLGTYTPEERVPRVVIVGPTTVRFREALGHGTARYRADISDLRAPVNAQWTGVTQPNGLSASVFFTRAGRENIGVTVTDADGLSDSATVTVRVSVIPLEDGQQPF